MSVRRINPENGVIEERRVPIDPVSDGEWKPLVNEHGTSELSLLRSRSGIHSASSMLWITGWH